MNSTYELKMKLPASRCDHEGKLSAADAVAMFLDMASEHADLLNVGTSDLKEEHHFWVCAKTMLHFEKAPRIGEPIVLTTWPEDPERFAANRDYRMTGGSGELLVEGKTQWVIVDIETGRPCATKGIYPDDLVPPADRTCPVPFSRIRDDFDGPVFATYTVTSEDIDIGLHMNNAKYVRAFMRIFSLKQWTEMNVRDLEIQYKTPCHEGDVLAFKMRDAGEGITEYRMSLEGKTIAFIRTKHG